MTPQSTVKDTNPKDAIGSTKLPWHVLPWRVLAGVVLAFLGGALKYRAHNYRVAGVRASIYTDGATRHIARFTEGEDWDPDVTGYDKGVRIHHLDEAIAGLMVLRDSMLQGNWQDDRPPRVTADWAPEANAMARLIIESTPNPARGYTQAELTPPTPTPFSAGADTPVASSPAPFMPSHDSESGDIPPEPIVSPGPMETLPLYVAGNSEPVAHLPRHERIGEEPIPEGVTTSGDEYGVTTFYRGNVGIDEEGGPPDGDYSHPNSFWTKWHNRTAEFPR